MSPVTIDVFSEDRSLKRILNPSSIAVIGASELTFYSRDLLNNLRRYGYKGEIYPINPKYSELMGLKCYKSLTDVPNDIDLGIYVVGRQMILETLQECKRKNMKGVLIISAGFGESDADGRRLQEEVKNFARESGIRVWGPNCVGFLNLIDNVAASPLPDWKDAKPLRAGKIAVISHSGGLGIGSIFSYGHSKNIDFSYVLTTGNEADMEMSEFIKHLVGQTETKVITLLIEQLRNPAAFADAARFALERGKPIVAMKLGQTGSGAKVTLTHTGAMAGSSLVYDAFFKQNGVVTVQDMHDLVEVSGFLAKCIPIRDRGVAVVSASGGLAAHSADLCEQLGLSLPDIGGTQIQAELLGLKELLTFGIIRNPVDIRGQGLTIIPKIVDILSKDERIQTIVIASDVSGVGEASKRIAKDIIEVSSRTPKQLAALWTGSQEPDGDEDIESTGYRLLQKSNVPFFDNPTRGFRAIKTAVDYFANRERILTNQANKSYPTERKPNLPHWLEKSKGVLSDEEAIELLNLYNIKMPKTKIARTADEAVSIATEIGYPIALKVSSPDVPHATEAGGIRLNVRSEREVHESWDEILRNAKRYAPNSRIEGCIVQEMVANGVEVIVGVTRDPQFGPLVVFGIGGIAVELTRDISMRFPPLTGDLAKDMMREIKGYRILEGYRGGTKADIGAVEDLLQHISMLAVDLKDRVREIDLNPVIVLPEGNGAWAVDTLVVLN